MYKNKTLILVFSTRATVSKLFQPTRTARTSQISIIPNFLICAKTSQRSKSAIDWALSAGILPEILSVAVFDVGV